MAGEANKGLSADIHTFLPALHNYTTGYSFPPTDIDIPSYSFTDQFHNQLSDIDINDDGGDYIESKSTPGDITRKIPDSTSNKDAISTKRKEQNRAAQRAFRERHRNRLNELEDMVQDLKRNIRAYNQYICHLRARIAHLEGENSFLYITSKVRPSNTV
ncbi:hypothetical protein BGW36DRAFT_383055 [Talaromyces proteolyticus]|uniref:BZIP domain-containing protein n=1 Tax=Talaromyces proteolyticus TaxID=1131652 RepID=A0AAD4PWZ6_9EURO|nr:uncharacterized protein BGW36DRAFT_383055 [Talaromyces proteolyticus]KAH8695650.1 hypothetical protein BGW36DRAFT_383055 [Talaromyces proteolyticus]